MKNTHSFLIAIALITTASQAKAGVGPSCHEGIAASPKVSAALNERCMIHCASQTQATSSTINTTQHTAIAASPKVLQMRNEQMLARMPQVGSQTVAYQPTSSDNIAASPKVRAALDERSQTVEIAPLK
jgi:hypothetical protein